MSLPRKQKVKEKAGESAIDLLTPQHWLFCIIKCVLRRDDGVWIRALTVHNEYK